VAATVLMCVVHYNTTDTCAEIAVISHLACEYATVCKWVGRRLFKCNLLTYCVDLI